jgi:hypothetical protein
VGHRLADAVAAAALAAAVLGMVPAVTNAQAARPDRIDGHPNLNGIWQAQNSAYWNLEAHPAEALDDFWQLGAFGAIPAGQSVVVGGTIPYLPDALAQREENRAGWPKTDPAAKCYLPGIPRATYQPFPFQIIQGDGDILFVYEFASANRPVYMSEKDHLTYDEVPVDQWMGWSNGSWDDDTLVVQVVANDDRTWLDRAGNYHSNRMTVTERYTLMDKDHIQYEATIEDPQTFSRPWTIRMPLYRHVEPNAEMLEYKCVEFSETLLYGKYLKNPPKELRQ